MNETVTYVVMFIIVAVIIGIGITMLGTVVETSDIQTETIIIPRANFTSITITNPNTNMYTATGACTTADFRAYEVEPVWRVYDGTTYTFYKYACLKNTSGSEYVGGVATTNSTATFTATCEGARSGSALNEGTPVRGRTQGASTDTLTLTPVSLKTTAEIGNMQCGGTSTYASAWGDVMKTYEDQSQSSYGLLIIILIVIAAVVILFVLRYLY